MILWHRSGTVDQARISHSHYETTNLAKVASPEADGGYGAVEGFQSANLLTKPSQGDVLPCEGGGS